MSALTGAKQGVRRTIKSTTFPLPIGEKVFRNWRAYADTTAGVVRAGAGGGKSWTANLSPIGVFEQDVDNTGVGDDSDPGDARRGDHPPVPRQRHRRQRRYRVVPLPRRLPLGQQHRDDVERQLRLQSWPRVDGRRDRRYRSPSIHHVLKGI